jgi:hypothetical protein
MGARRVSKARAEKWLHRLENLFAHRRRGGVVEVDGICGWGHGWNLRAVRGHSHSTAPGRHLSRKAERGCFGKLPDASDRLRLAVRLRCAGARIVFLFRKRERCGGENWMRSMRPRPREGPERQFPNNSDPLRGAITPMGTDQKHSRRFRSIRVNTPTQMPVGAEAPHS